MSEESFICYPNAKINIGLNVVERRADNYHNIETIFYPIPLYDRLEIQSSQTVQEYSLSSTGNSIDGKKENNLVVKAYQLLKHDYQLMPIDIFLEKNIPSGAGLGGGSADAAFMLGLLNKMNKLDLSNEQLELYALRLGADCPFFINNKPVFASGVGNIFKSINLSLKGYWMLLIKPNIHVSTAEAYRGIKPHPTTIPLTDLIQLPVKAWRDSVKNDFELTVFRKFPQISNVKNFLYELGAEYSSMSGSGSSVYGIFSNEPQFEGLFNGCFCSKMLLK